MSALPAFVGLVQKLPVNDRSRRRQLFERFDPNCNDILSLAEVDKGLMDLWRLEADGVDATKHCKPAILRAFAAAKDATGNKNGPNADFVTRREFRLLLVFLQRYFELFAAFEVIETGNDRRINAAEFARATKLMRSWGVYVRNLSAEFASIDANGGGQVLFDEFAGWAIRRGIELVDDDPEEGEEWLYVQHKSAADEASAAARRLAARRKDGTSGLPAGWMPAQGEVPQWVRRAEVLPTGRSANEKRARRKLYELFDPNSNGYLSLAEVDKGLLELLRLEAGCDDVTKHCKPAILRAFQAAKDLTGSTEGHHADFVTRSEFRLLLVYIQRYFELFAAFEVIDTGDDRRINAAEFMRATKLMRSWGVYVRNPKAEFASIDANGGGQVLFDEFASWAIRRGMELVDDDDDPEEGEATLTVQHKSAADEVAAAARRSGTRAKKLKAAEAARQAAEAKRRAREAFVTLGHSSSRLSSGAGVSSSEVLHEQVTANQRQRRLHVEASRKSIMAKAKADAKATAVSVPRERPRSANDKDAALVWPEPTPSATPTTTVLSEPLGVPLVRRNPHSARQADIHVRVQRRGYRAKTSNGSDWVGMYQDRAEAADAQRMSRAGLTLIYQREVVHSEVAWAGVAREEAMRFHNKFLGSDAEGRGSFDPIAHVEVRGNQSLEVRRRVLREQERYATSRSADAAPSSHAALPTSGMTTASPTIAAALAARAWSASGLDA